MSNPISNWKHSDYLIKFYNRFVDELGEPSYIVNKKNGIVVWDQNSKNKKWGNWIVEHYLRDEKIDHCVPKRHTDFFYTTVKIFIPKNKVEQVQSISGSVILDLLKNTVTARCASTNANYATLRTVVEVLETNFNYPKKEISELYKMNLTNMKDKEYNMKRVRDYVRKHPVKDIQYHPFAFPEACDKVDTFVEPPKNKGVSYKPKTRLPKDKSNIEPFNNFMELKKVNFN